MKTINKCLDILEIFLQNKKEMSIAELSKLSGMNRTTIYRICSTLVKRGFLYRQSNSKCYSLGLKLNQFPDVANVTVRIRDIALPYMQRLVKEFSESAILSIREGEDLVDICTIISNQRMKVLGSEGDRSPLYCTAAGKLFLAEMSEDEINRIYKSRKLTRLTEKTIVDLNELKKQLLIVKNEGVGFCYEEFDEWINAVAVPIRDSNDKVVATLDIIGPSSRLSDKRIKEIIPHLKHSAKQISTDIIKRLNL